MPYEVFQGGRRRKRRRWPRLVAVLVAARRRPGRRADAGAEARAEAARAGHTHGRGAAERRRPRTVGGRRDGAVAALGAARRPARPRAPALQAPAALGADVRPRHRPGAVAARPHARAADRLADEDDDRGADRPARAAEREGADHQGGAVLQGLGRRPVPPWAAHPRQDDALRAAAAVRQRRGDRARPARGPRLAQALRGDDEPRGAGDGPRVHALHVARRLRRPRQPLVRARPRRARPRGAARAADRPHRAPPPGRAAVPDQGREDLPLQPQPVAAAGLSRRHGRQDGLHGRGRPLPRGDRAARPRAARRGAAALTGSRHAGAQAARPRLPAWIDSGYDPERWPPLLPALPSSGAGASSRSASCC